MRRFIFSVLVVGLLFSFYSVAKEPVYLFLEADGGKGMVNPLGIDDMNPHPLEPFWYTESWFFIAILDDGHIAYVNLMLSNMGLKKHQPGLTISIITPDGKRLTTEAEYEPEDLEVSRDRFRLKVGSNVLEGDSKDLRLTLYHQGLGMDIEFKGCFPGYKVGDGTAWFGKDRGLFYYIDYPAPRPRVKGAIIVEDRKIKAKGWGYVDHCYYNGDTTDFEEVWHNFKFHSDEYSIVLTSFTTPGTYGNKNVALATIMDDERVICATTDVTVVEKDHELDPVGGKNNPKTLEFEFRCTDMTARATFDASNIVERMDVLEKLDKGAASKALKFVINTFIARPYYYRSRNETVVNMTIDGEEKEVKGEAVSEVIFVK